MKKIISGLAILSMLLVMLASCTPNGTPLSLVGVWKADSDPVMYMEITNKDEIYYGSKKDNLQKAAEITKCTCDEITTKTGNIEETSKYELSGNNLTFTLGGHEFKCTRE